MLFSLTLHRRQNRGWAGGGGLSPLTYFAKLGITKHVPSNREGPSPNFPNFFLQQTSFFKITYRITKSPPPHTLFWEYVRKLRVILKIEVIGMLRYLTHIVITCTCTFPSALSCCTVWQPLHLFSALPNHCSKNVI